MRKNILLSLIESVTTDENISQDSSQDDQEKKDEGDESQESTIEEVFEVKIAVFWRLRAFYTEVVISYPQEK